MDWTAAYGAAQLPKRAVAHSVPKPANDADPKRRRPIGPKLFPQSRPSRETGPCAWRAQWGSTPVSLGSHVQLPSRKSHGTSFDDMSAGGDRPKGPIFVQI